MRRIYKVPFSDFTPIPTYFRILIAHSSLLQLNVITGPLPHLFLYQKNAFNCHTNIYCLPNTFLSILRKLVPKFTNFNEAQILPYSSASSFLVETVFI